ncbi:hypothetical protein AOLI_G00134880 [Acnodon oligacanthus]
MHLTPSHEVLPTILRKEIQRETDPEKWRALKKDYFKLLQTRIMTEKAVQDIAKLTLLERGPRALICRCPVTRLDDMKAVAELFRKTLSEEQDDCCVLSQMHVIASLIDSGVKDAK